MTMTRFAYSALAIVSFLTGDALGFVPKNPSSLSTTSRLLSSTKEIETPFRDLPPIKDISYGEESRKYRRTVYSHDDWRKHRSPDRFIYYLLSLGVSGVYKNIGREVLATTSIATIVCLYNALVTGYTDFEGVQHAALVTSQYLPKIGLPLAPFTLASPSLGLLLVFRTNTSYQRWDEARKNWGMNINHTRDLVRQGNAYYDKTGVSEQERQEDLNDLALCTWSFVRCMKRHLSPEDEDEADFQAELYEKLPPQQAQKIIDAAHRPNRALQDLSYSIENLNMHFMRKNEIHKACTIFEDNLGSSERLLTSPVPLFYSRHTARFVAAWLLLLPFALYDAFASSWNHIAMIPATAVISVFLFGIEELATQLEEPFTILPMQAFCDKIYNWCTEIMTWQPGDNGTPVKPVQPDHQYFAAVPPPHSAADVVQQQSHAVVEATPVAREQVAAKVESQIALSFEDFLASQGKQ
jgi:predicted membrane chloride channel (bestrophin family)